jgi:DNA-binding XRE family transcriptional regulator
LNLNLRVMQIRKNLKITQTELALKCKTTQQTIAKIEQGVVDPKLFTLQKIAEALDCELTDLFYTREHFAADVNEIVKNLGLNLNKLSSVNLNHICWENAHISTFHPFWQKYKVKNNKIVIEN